MRHKSLEYIVYSQAVFLIGIALCFVAAPQFLTERSSISYFGNLRATIIPYTAGFIGSIFCISKAVQCLPQERTLKVLRAGLTAVAALMSLVLLTPYTVDKFFLIAHTAVSAVLFLTEMVLGYYLVFVAAKSLINQLLLIVNVASLICLVLSLGEVHVLHILKWAELLSDVLFTIIIVTSAKRLLTKP